MKAIALYNFRGALYSLLSMWMVALTNCVALCSDWVLTVDTQLDIKPERQNQIAIHLGGAASTMLSKYGEVGAWFQ